MPIKGSDLCPCGSKKRYKNCCKNNQKSPIAVTIDIDLENVDRFDGIAISNDGKVSGHKNGVLQPLAGKNSILFRNSNTARKKPLTGGRTSNDYLHIDPNSILAPYKNILAVDTNTRENIVDGNKISVSAMIHCVIERQSENHIYIQYSLVGAWEFWNLEAEQEQHFWWFLIDKIENGTPDEAYKNGNIAILTDCDRCFSR